MFQSEAVKVRLAGLTEPSLGSVLVTGITTLADGWRGNATVKVAAPPASVSVPSRAPTTGAPSSSRIVR